MDGHNEDIRKAFERLQRTIGLVADRTRGLQRERKLLLGRIDELEEACLTMDAAVSERSDEALRGRERAAELEEQVLRSQKDQQELHNRVAALENELKDREGLIAEQEDALAQARLRIEEFESGRSVSSELQNRIAALEEEVKKERARADELAANWAQKEESLEAEKKNEGETLRTELEEERRRLQERAAEWEHRIAAAENLRDEMKESAEVLIRERDQARATVESMLVRVRQLEAGGDEQTSGLQQQIDSLTGDLEEALEMASAKEAEAGELREQLTQLQKKAVDTNGKIVLDEEEQNELMSQVEAALTLIDKHLSDTA